MEILEFDGVKFNLDALKGYTKGKFVKQNKNRFKNVDAVWKMIEDKLDALKPKKKGKKAKKVEEVIEEKLSFDKVDKPEFD